MGHIVIPLILLSFMCLLRPRMKGRTNAGKSNNLPKKQCGLGRQDFSWIYFIIIIFYLLGQGPGGGLVTGCGRSAGRGTMSRSSEAVTRSPWPGPFAFFCTYTSLADDVPGTRLMDWLSICLKNP